MSPQRSHKPRVAIVGTGNLAIALAPSLFRAGYGIDQVISRGRGSSLRRARSLAREVDTSVVKPADADIRAEVIWFCVPDSAIVSAAKSLWRTTDWHGKIALHSSGALSSDELALLRRRGASIASVHPLMTFVRGSRPRLVGVPFAIEGDSKAVRMA